MRMNRSILIGHPEHNRPQNPSTDLPKKLIPGLDAASPQLIRAFSEKIGGSRMTMTPGAGEGGATQKADWCCAAWGARSDQWDLAPKVTTEFVPATLLPLPASGVPARSLRSAA